jgi:hypothetical protein
MSKLWRDTVITLLVLVAGGAWWKVRENRRAAVEECAYLGGDLGRCLVERHGWRVEKAERLATDSLRARLRRGAAARAMREGSP